MFGYVSANKNELSEEDKEAYQSYYCGLCRELKSEAGAVGQILLNYDMAFLTILLTGLYELPDESEEFTCKVHPRQKKHSYINEATKYAAKMDIILSYYNFMDDYLDEGSYSKKKLMDSLKKSYDEIKLEYPRQVAAVEQYIKDVSDAEKRKEKNLDIISGYTGTMMQELLDWRENDLWSRDLRSLGFYLGKFIYIMDAYEDREKDLKNGNYNPLIEIYDKQPETYETFCQQTLNTMIAEAARSFERMPILMHAEILRNILYSGVWTRYEYKKLKIQTKDEKKHLFQHKNK